MANFSNTFELQAVFIIQIFFGPLNLKLRRFYCNEKTETGRTSHHYNHINFDLSSLLAVLYVMEANYIALANCGE